MPSQITYGETDPANPLSELQNNKYSFDQFSYPPDLFTNPALNHYVCFYINQTQNTNFNSLSQTASQAPIQKNSEQGTLVNPDGTISAASSDIPTSNQNAIAGPGSTAGANNIRNTQRTNTAIALYMPDLALKEEHGWSKEELGMAGSLTGFGKLVALNKIQWSDAFAAVESLSRIGGDVFTGMLNKAGQVADAITQTNVSGAVGLGARLVYNAHLEVLYQGPTFRTFNFQFKLSPRTPQEAQLIANIIRAFRFYSAPELNTNSLNAGRYFVYPAEFDIKFFSNGKPNTFLNRISTCALTNIDVDYTGGNGWTAFAPDNSGNLNTNGVPIQTTLKLTFMEVEIMTKLRILQGF
jgi:hypothetical protein